MSEIKKIIIIFAAGLLYLIWALVTNITIPCVFNKLTGLLCPACGITRMIIAVVKFDFSAAYSYNKLLFVTWPLILIPLIYSEIMYIKYNKRKIGYFNILIYIEIILLVLFGIIRNII